MIGPDSCYNVIRLTGTCHSPRGHHRHVLGVGDAHSTSAVGMRMLLFRGLFVWCCAVTQET